MIDTSRYGDNLNPLVEGYSYVKLCYLDAIATNPRMQRPAGRVLEPLNNFTESPASLEQKRHKP